MEVISSKVILSGEHAVLRGGSAVVASNRNYALKYETFDSDSFELELTDELVKYEILFLGTLEKALGLLGLSKTQLKKKIKVYDIVPLGMGLGGSAALCVFFSKILMELSYISESEVFDLSHKIEDMFHGKSSGLDISGCMHHGIIYYKDGVSKEIDLPSPKNKYVFTLHDSGERGDTKDCIDKVLSLRNSDKKSFFELDEMMSESSLDMKKGLEQCDADKIVSSMTASKEIFRRWSLETDALCDIYKKLERQSALACRTTGSGLGGGVIAFWNKDQLPDDYIKKIFLEV